MSIIFHALSVSELNCDLVALPKLNFVTMRVPYINLKTAGACPQCYFILYLINWNLHIAIEIMMAMTKFHVTLTIQFGIIA